MAKVYKVILCCMLGVSTWTQANDDSSQDHKQNLSQSTSVLGSIVSLRLSHFTSDALANQPEHEKDPLQPLNRKIYAFNDVLDKNLLRPMAVQYQTKIPEDIRGGYANVHNNLREPWNATNQVLQAKPKVALKSLGRFLVNTITTLGIADNAKHLDLIQEKENFGTTLGVWGVKSGPYMVIPFLGPSTFRDNTGLIFDIVAQPQGYILEQDKIYWANNLLQAIDTRSQYLSVDSIVQGDQYAVLRDVYLQQRAFTIASKRGEDASGGMFIEDSFPDDEFMDEEITDEENLGE